jgi:hypothetical protein
MTWSLYCLDEKIVAVNGRCQIAVKIVTTVLVVADRWWSIRRLRRSTPS